MSISSHRKKSSSWLFICALLLFAPSAYSLTPQGVRVTPELKIAAVIHTQDKGSIEALWHYGGEDKTARGDKVIWGFFYADPQTVAWGSDSNPELYVKIWQDVSGRTDVNFFHVSVPDIEVLVVLNA